jgi:hypothetical protein
MRYLIILLLLLPTLAFTQTLHTFKNGEVADAEKVNENFLSLSNSVGTVVHPEGDLVLTRDDESSSISFDFNERWLPVTLEVNGATYEVRDSNTDKIYTQQGLVFRIKGYYREHPPVEVSNNICPGPQRATPYESVWTFYNEYGTITMSTGSEYYVDGVLRPDRIPELTSGDFYCEDGTYWYVWRLEGATGRYKCAINTELDRIYSSSCSGSADESWEPVSLDWKSPGAWITHRPARACAFLNLNIPATCD